MNENMIVAFCIIAIVLVAVVTRILINRLIETTNSKERFGVGVGIFVLYTIILEMFFYLIYKEILPQGSGIKECYQYMAFGVIVINLCALFIGVVYYLMRNKRKISEVDKMKLKDM